MKTKHIVHFRINGKNIRVESETFEGAVNAVNAANPKNEKITDMEHMVGLGE